MTLFLGLDCSGGGLSVALGDGSAVLAHHAEALARGHAERILPAVREVLAAAGLAPSAIERIAVTMGPGSFTGIRIGLAAARGLGFALSIAVEGVTSLEAVAHATQPEGGRPLAVLIDSKRGDVFAQLFDADRAPLAEPAAISRAALDDFVPADALVVGDAAAICPPGGDRLIQPSGPPDAAMVIAVAAGRTTPRPARPLYIRPPDAAVPAGGGRLRP